MIHASKNKSKLIVWMHHGAFPAPRRILGAA